MTNRTALFISPHLDDVAFSCAGTLAVLKAAGWKTVLATVFTQSVAHPEGFALACQTDKGLEPDVDYMALRREEDAGFGRVVGVDGIHWLDLPEAPHRGYDSAGALFSGVSPADGIWTEVAARIGALADAVNPRLVFACQALGGHVDHRQTVRAVLELKRPTLWYRDLPYAIRAPEEAPPVGLPGGLMPLAVPITGHLDVKIAGACRYTSQLAFQFGGVERVGPALTDFAAGEAARAGMTGYAERFLVKPGGVARPW
ncbi:N-acetylglucosaminylphosphatidylinositol deacetylase [Skermanella stibiiresistens SB22]|uniref:N-acetylglucosaminylphosphatidylinositol deacetylase n=1 Tax=Skermanella stibiiresistens SB22 TaxID=1385369 RepID=W9GRL7_9PROT|nr:PIG-L family deacetylase [Skermanella stibiiresistens]EWY36555.1 N-acetylglucosaminylphosphatidylinositol deacetylase [Skermanella stibiiresistens SB22]